MAKTQGLNLLAAARKKMKAASENDDEDKKIDDEQDAQTPAEGDDGDEEEPDGDEGLIDDDTDENAEGDDDEETAEDDDGDEEDTDTGSSPAAKHAVAAERNRCAAILNCKQAKGRTASAQHLATQTNMSATAAQALLATMPKAAKAGRLNSLMSAGLDTNIGPDAVVGGGNSPTADVKANGILANLQKATGRKPRTR